MRFIVVFIVYILVFSCEKELKPNKPNDLISEEQMVEILYDIYILNAAKSVNKKLLEVKGVRPEEFVLTKYNIDSLQFAQSNEYYAYDFERYQVIMDTLKAKINRKKQIYEETKEKEELVDKQRRDSINRIIKLQKDSSAMGIKRRTKEIKDTIRQNQN